MAGTTVETAIRIMSKMQKEGIVKTDRQMITVLDPASLSELLLT
jgi:CRP/FNR family transcriptional regulator